ncbi:transposase [Aquabacterium sp. A7-Y]|uniref:transposase n=1 Tax=Aquabacterium sp. A7-Y TaxID=1349605 RepID=UPI0039FC2005
MAYDEQAKTELVALCAAPGASVSRLARECGVNANQLSRWVRENAERRQRALAAPAVPAQAAVVPMTMEMSTRSPAEPTICVHARQPNGVVVELGGCDLIQAGQVIEVLGRMRCSVSTKGPRSTCTVSPSTSG